MPSIFKSASRRAKGAEQGGVPKGQAPLSLQQVTVLPGQNGYGKGQPRGLDTREFGVLQQQQQQLGGPSRLLEGARSSKTTLPTPPHSPLFPHPHPHAPLLPPKYTFLPTHLPHTTSSDNSIDSTRYSDPDIRDQRAYGFLGGIGARVVLGLEDVRRAVIDVAKELESRGLATPMLFSTGAVDANKGRTGLLIQAYLDMASSHQTSSPSSSTSRSFASDLRYAKEHELAWFLRWALSRVTRKREGTGEVCHGLIEWEVYEEWRGRERAAGYPADAFPYLAGLLASPVFLLLQPLFHLLSRLAAHSHLSGLTPHALSSYFAPLLFDIPVSIPALGSHAHFVRAASATEHLLLAYIRSTSRSADLGLNDLPGRLKEWVAGYPGMVVSDNDLARGLPRKGARVIRCERATRTVRAYSKDLVASAESWATEKDQWPAWERVILRPKSGRDGGDVARPKFTQGYRRRMIVKEQPALPASSGAEAREPTVYGQSRLDGTQKRTKAERKEGSDEDGRWGSLAGKEWSMFEEGGFGSNLENNQGLGDKLRFDLTESAKLSITERRRTMDWTDFASDSGGFTRTDPALSTTLTLSRPVEASIEQWPRDRSDLSKRLHKSQKESIPFNYDTTPRFGPDSRWPEEGEGGKDGKGRVYFEEAFVDFWADLAMGGGWVDRAELTFRGSNWAVLEYRARPPGEVDVHPREDPRTAGMYFLFEEKVPFEYQVELANPQEKRSFSLFSSKTKKRTPKSATMPHLSRLAATPPSRATGVAGEFERMLSDRSATKKVTLGGTGQKQEASIWQKQVTTAGSGSPVANRTLGATASGMAGQPTAGTASFVVKSRDQGHLPEHNMRSTSASATTSHEAVMGVPLVKTNFFTRGRSTRKPAPSVTQAEAALDYELQSASGVGSPASSREAHDADDDKWMDILVANGARRMDRQDATPASPPRALLQPRDRDRDDRAPSPPSPPRHSQDRLPTLQQSYHSPDVSGEPEEELQTPRVSDFLPPHHHAEASSGSTAAYELAPAVLPKNDSTLPLQKRVSPTCYDRRTPSAMYEAEHPAPGAEAEQLHPGTGTDSPPRIPSKSQHQYHQDPPEQGQHYPDPYLHTWSSPTSLASASRDESGSDHPDIRAPSPRRRRGRDTIHNIVDTYRDSDISSGYDGEDTTTGTGTDTGRYSSEREDGAPTSDQRDSSEFEFGSEREASEAGEAGHGRVLTKPWLGVTALDPEEGADGEDGLAPPKPLFDLTPTREPSPGRYRHGEALHFVQEEPDEERYR